MTTSVYREYYYVVIIIVISIFILRLRISTFKKCLCILCISLAIYLISLIYEKSSAKPLEVVEWQEGTVITYSLFNPFDSFFMVRLLGINYTHAALVVRDNDELKVMEMRSNTNPIQCKGEMISKAQKLFSVMLFPLKEYLQTIHRDLSYVFRIYQPNKKLSITLDRSIPVALQKEHGVMTCVMLVHRYLNYTKFIKDEPGFVHKYLKYHPVYLFSMLEQEGWTSTLYTK